jgi:hypothetical protein
MLGTAIAGVVLAALVATFTKTGTHPSFRMGRCLMGFLIAIVWIMAIADEVVNVLQVCATGLYPLSIFTVFCADIWAHLWPV